MNGSYYQTPVFINDIERDTYEPKIYNKEYNMEVNIWI